MNPFLNAILDIQNAPSIFLDGSEKFSGFKAMDPGFNFMMGKNPVDGHYYFTVLGRGGGSVNRNQFVYKLDYDSLEILQEYEISNTLTSSYDSHLKSVINFDDSGNILVAFEKGDNSSGLSDGHNTEFLLYKTTTAGDLTTLTLVKEIAGYFSYPKLWIEGDTYISNVRGSVSALNLSKSTILKSLDAGVTWIEYNIIDLASTDYRAYTFSIDSLDTGELILILNVRNEIEGSFESLSVLKSTDGITWSNWEGTFSKNTNTAGPLTHAEVEANMLVWKIDPSIEAVNFEGGIVKNGEIKLLATRSTTTNVIVSGNTQQELEELRLYSFSSGWVFEDLSKILPTNFLFVWGLERIMQYVSGLDNDNIFFLDRTNTNDCKLFKYSSNDGFITYNKELVYSDAGEYYYGSNAFNVLDESHLIALTVGGDVNDLNSTSNLRIIKP
jgi:hypothetical protein